MWVCVMSGTWIFIERAAAHALQNPEDVSAKIKNARHRFEDRYSETTVMQILERYYAGVLESPYDSRNRPQAS